VVAAMLEEAPHLSAVIAERVRSISFTSAPRLRASALLRNASTTMVVETALGAALRVAARPHANVHSVDGRSFQQADGGRAAPEGLRCRSALGLTRRRGCPAATVRRFEAQVNGRRDGGIRGEDGVGEFEQGVRLAMEAVVERIAEDT
jgi:hypothetical protein